MLQETRACLIVLLVTLSGGCISDEIERTDLVVEEPDVDGDGIPDSVDLDDDDDGWSDYDEENCSSNHLDNSSFPLDLDGDSTCDPLDDDVDGDGVLNEEDAFPMDIDEHSDHDGDGIGDGEDEDDDGDGWLDNIEIECDKDPLIASSVPQDRDGDGLCNHLDADLLSLLEGFRNYTKLENHTSDPEWYGMNITTWQHEGGGWRKNFAYGYMNPWNGDSKVPDRSTYFANLSTLADMGTVNEIRFLSSLYQTSQSSVNKSAFKQSVEDGITFILDAQNESGGWPQVYPPHLCSDCGYHQLMTYNDHVIVNAMLLLMDVSTGVFPFDSDIVENLNISRVNAAMESGIQFILDSQIIVEGVRTIWGQQHDPYTFESMPARSYELAGKVAAESAGVVALLLNWENRTEAVIEATWAAVDWFNDNMVTDSYYMQDSNGTILDISGQMMWYRFYNTTDDQYFFSGRDGIKVYSIQDLDSEMRSGYAWAGSWGMKMMIETNKVSAEDRF